eukprot:GHVN01002347.1.p2 GENE.GHVN01002347.1~~GHVN01002347.1.p2  ORF type:complete len:548 (-),score=5.57 GHVN01002347.1:3384-5027(-)
MLISKNDKIVERTSVLYNCLDLLSLDLSNTKSISDSSPVYSQIERCESSLVTLYDAEDEGLVKGFVDKDCNLHCVVDIEGSVEAIPGLSLAFGTMKGITYVTRHTQEYFESNNQQYANVNPMMLTNCVVHRGLNVAKNAVEGERVIIRCLKRMRRGTSTVNLTAYITKIIEAPDLGAVSSIILQQPLHLSWIVDITGVYTDELVLSGSFITTIPLPVDTQEEKDIFNAEVAAFYKNKENGHKYRLPVLALGNSLIFQHGKVLLVCHLITGHIFDVSVSPNEMFAKNPPTKQINKKSTNVDTHFGQNIGYVNVSSYPHSALEEILTQLPSGLVFTNIGCVGNDIRDRYNVVITFCDADDVGCMQKVKAMYYKYLPRTYLAYRFKKMIPSNNYNSSEFKKNYSHNLIYSDHVYQLASQIRLTHSEWIQDASKNREKYILVLDQDTIQTGEAGAIAYRAMSGREYYIKSHTGNRTPVLIDEMAQIKHFNKMSKPKNGTTGIDIFDPTWKKRLANIGHFKYKQQYYKANDMSFSSHHSTTMLEIVKKHIMK